MALQTEYALGSFEMLKAQGRILLALMLRIIKSRLGGNEFGFVVMGIGWPLSHILALLVINAGLGRAAPYGDSAALWFATGVVPFLAFQYMARFIMTGTVLNRPLFSFPVVKVADVVFAAAIVEVLNAGLLVIIVGAIFWALGIDFMPRDAVQAGLAMLAMMGLGLAWGVVGAVAGSIAPGLMMPFFLFQIVMWISSGILFVPDALPEAVRTPLSYLPYLQGVEWMRSAYYEGFGAGVLDKTYMISFTVILLFVGLALERLVRGKMLQ
jgi:capsular polysaccharide transport system permease protein